MIRPFWERERKQFKPLRLKFAIVDVASGNWTLFSPEPLEDTAISATLNRESSDQDQVALLKGKAYTDAVEKLVRVYGD